MVYLYIQIRRQGSEEIKTYISREENKPHSRAIYIPRIFGLVAAYSTKSVVKAYKIGRHTILTLYSVCEDMTRVHCALE